MESSSIIYTSPSFNRHSSNNIANIADRVVNEFRAKNGFINDDDDVFSFSDDDIPADSGEDDGDEVNTITHTEATDEGEHEFEFPVICGESELCVDSVDELISDDQISPRYPLFDRSLLSNVDLNLCNGVDALKIDSKPPEKRSSLMKLFNEDRDTSSPSTSTSSSSSEAEELDGVTPGTYCVWKPKTEPRGKHKKSNSISIGNTSNRWKVRDLLKRSYSDDNYSAGKESPVFLFIPPVSPEKVNKIGKSAKIASNKPENKLPAYRSKIGNIRLPPYLPYRRDQIAAFANFDGANRHIYR